MLQFPACAKQRGRQTKFMPLMMKLGSRWVCLFWLLTVFFLQTGAQAALISTTISSSSDGLSYYVFIATEVFTNADGTSAGPDLSGGLLQVTNSTGSVPFSIPLQTPVFSISTFQADVPAGVLSENYTLIWSNYSMTLAIGSPEFTIQPQPQSVFVGSTVTFSAQAVHTTGLYWQKDGTNLVDDGHFFGTTNSNLTITNVQPADAGNYMAVTTDPTNSQTSDSAQLSVFKPIQLGLANNSPAGVVLLVVNQDGSPFETNRIANLTILSSTDLVNWEDVTEDGLLTNGSVQFLYSFVSSTNCFWRVMESPSP